MSFPPIPEIAHSDYSSMNAKELRLAQETLWAWISAAEAAPLSEAPDDDTIDIAREALSDIISERRSLHGDEPAPRGG